MKKTIKNKTLKTLLKTLLKEFTGNIVVGKDAGTNLTEAKNCIFIGDNAGNKITKGKNLLVVRFGKKESKWTLTPKEIRFMKGVLYAQIGEIPKHLLFK